MARSASRTLLALPVRLRISMSANKQKIAPPSKSGPRCECCRAPGRPAPATLAAYHLPAAPHLLSGQSSNLGSGNRLHVGCDSFFDPMMAVLDGWKTEMNHFVGQLPVVVEIGQGGMLTHPNPASRPGFTKSSFRLKCGRAGKEESGPGHMSRGTCRSTP